VCAGPGDEVNFDEAPDAANLEGRDLASGGESAQRHRMQAQRGGGFGERQKGSRHLFASPARSNF
jgi:hypothetical protein